MHVGLLVQPAAIFSVRSAGAGTTLHEHPLVLPYNITVPNHAHEGQQWFPNCAHKGSTRSHGLAFLGSLLSLILSFQLGLLI